MNFCSFAFVPPTSQKNLLIFGAALVDAIREDVSMLTLLAEVLCLLDMIVNSFAHTISTKAVDQYIRPQFTGLLLKYLLVYM